MKDRKNLKTREYLSVQYRSHNGNPHLLLNMASGLDHPYRAEIREFRGQMEFDVLDHFAGDDKKRLETIIATAEAFAKELPAMLEFVQRAAADARKELAKLVEAHAVKEVGAAVPLHD